MKTKAPGTTAAPPGTSCKGGSRDMWYFIEVVLKGANHSHTFTIGDKAAEAEEIYSGMQKCKEAEQSASIDGTINAIGITIDMTEVVMFKLFCGEK